YYFHHGDFGENDKYLDDAIEVMHKLRDEGKIRLIGQSAYSHADFVKLISKVKPDVTQSSASALDDKYVRDDSPTRKMLDEYNVSFVAFGPVAQGLLLGKYHQGNPPQFEAGDHRANAERFKPENLAQLEPKIEKMKNKFGPSNQELSRAALQYLLHYKQVGSVIPGFRNLDQVKSNLSGMDNPLTQDEFDFIKQIFAE
ncbi:MAG TPA: aldo/keto reductase, partial [Ignavibacteriaceae bacterium]|nr:aldo/keto reductase [Ignavibacteriaceae bacterium]